MNSTHRADGIPTQFGLTAALAKGKADIKANAVKA